MQTEETGMDKIAVLIPCFNESKTIQKVICDWKRELPESVVYVYDKAFIAFLIKVLI